MDTEKMYHIGIDASHGAKYALLPGDPGRVPRIAQHLDAAQFYAQNREYTSYLGTLSGERVLVMSTGMGGPSTAIGVEELYRTGVRTFIRVGTCGGMQLDVQGGDVVVATGAIRAEGTTREYAPIEFPAVANIDVTNALIAEGRALDARLHAGVVQCKDSFYGQHEPGRMPVGDALLYKWKAWIAAGCLASEMESATLFVVSSVLRARAGCVLHVVWNQERRDAGLPTSESHDVEIAVKTAVGAVKRLIAADCGAGERG